MEEFNTKNGKVTQRFAKYFRFVSEPLYYRLSNETYKLIDDKCSMINELTQPNRQ